MRDAHCQHPQGSGCVVTHLSPRAVARGRYLLASRLLCSLQLLADGCVLFPVLGLVATRAVAGHLQRQPCAQHKQGNSMLRTLSACNNTSGDTPHSCRHWCHCTPPKPSNMCYPSDRTHVSKAQHDIFFCILGFIGSHLAGATLLD